MDFQERNEFFNATNYINYYEQADFASPFSPENPLHGIHDSSVSGLGLVVVVEQQGCGAGTPRVLEVKFVSSHSTPQTSRNKRILTTSATPHEVMETQAEVAKQAFTTVV